VSRLANKFTATDPAFDCRVRLSPPEASGGFVPLAQVAGDCLNMIMFMKNIAMLGGALLISQFGSGPLSLDNRKR
jgi:uncharacterized membrane protein YphA (DoxX/SURF4 family)